MTKANKTLIVPFNDFRGLDFGLGLGESFALLFVAISAARLKKQFTVCN